MPNVISIESYIIDHSVYHLTTWLMFMVMSLLRYLEKITNPMGMLKAPKYYLA